MRLEGEEGGESRERMAEQQDEDEGYLEEIENKWQPFGREYSREERRKICALCI